MAVLRSAVPLFVGLVMLAACSTVTPDELSARLPTTTASSTTTTTASPSSESTSTTTTTPAPDSADAASVPELDGLAGRLAIGGLPSLEVVSPDGSPLIAYAGAGQGVSQPTWSRDGDALIATVLDGPSGRVLLATEDGVVYESARRPYFFYSWSPTGQYIAALGPGPEGTTLDILGRDGTPVSEESLSTGSFYLAWEPGGDQLVVHRDRALGLVRDPLDLTTVEPLGEPGQSFLAPAWIPGTREVLIVDERADGNRLVRLDVDTAAAVDLGPVNGSIGISVAPDGSRAVLAHGFAGDGGDVAVAFRPVADVTAPTEMIDLATGDRSPMSDQQSLWTEWSPDGSTVALLQAGEVEALTWVIWSAEGLTGLGDFRPTVTFVRDYVFFSWQFTESPRVWSPDGDAIVYSARVGRENGIWVRPLEADAAVRVSDGTVAFWSPG